MFETFLLDGLIRIVLTQLSQDSILLAVIIVLLIAARIHFVGRH